MTVPITVVLNTLDERPQDATRRVRRFLEARLRALADVSDPDVLWGKWGDAVAVIWGHLGVEMLDVGEPDLADADDGG